MLSATCWVCWVCWVWQLGACVFWDPWALSQHTYRIDQIKPQGTKLLWAPTSTSDHKNKNAQEDKWISILRRTYACKSLSRNPKKSNTVQYVLRHLSEEPHLEASPALSPTWSGAFPKSWRQVTYYMSSLSCVWINISPSLTFPNLSASGSTMASYAPVHAPKRLYRLGVKAIWQDAACFTGQRVQEMNYDWKQNQLYKFWIHTDEKIRSCKTFVSEVAGGASSCLTVSMVP